MITIDEILTPEFFEALTAEIKDTVFAEASDKKQDAENYELSKGAAGMLIKIYVNAYNKGYDKAKSEVTELDRKTN